MTSLRSWFGSPYGLLCAFLVLTLGPAVGLVGLGWRMLEQDRALEAQRIEERREHAADQLVSALQQVLRESENDLARPNATLTSGEDTLIVEIGPSGMLVPPQEGLLFHPDPPPSREVPPRVFRKAEIYEFQRKDYQKAIGALRSLTSSQDTFVRAGALLRIARNQRKAGLFEDALDTYTKLAEYGETGLSGLPAELLARRARCALLAQLGRRENLIKEAAELYAQLRTGRWPLSRTSYDLFAEEVASWARADRTGEAKAVALSEAVSWLAVEEKTNPSDSGRACMVKRGRLVTILWRRGPEGLRALIAGPSYLERNWLAPLTTLAEQLRVEFALKEMNPGTASTERPPSATGLPWTLLVANRDVQAEMDEFAGRRNMLLAVFALVMIVIAAGSYTVARAIGREFAVMRLQSDFVAAVSHEFRTPLTSLRQLSEVLSSDRPLADERRRRYYQVLDRSTRRLHKLIEGLLDFGRMESRAMVYRKKDLDAAALTASVVEEFHSEAVTLGYSVELSVADDIPAIQADPEALGNAVWNLLDNAVKYSPECSKVWVELEREDSGLAIRVRDCGVGIPASEQRKILGKFVRGTAARSLGVKGTGIGLTMVKHTVEAHGGSLRLESEVGEGSTFSIWLPERR